MRFENQSDTEKYFYKFAGDGLRYEMVEFLERVGSCGDNGDEILIKIVDVIEKYNLNQSLIIE